jgi:hypothetical protein
LKAGPRYSRGWLFLTGAAFGIAGGFLVTPQAAYDVETTVVVGPPITTCFPVPSIGDPVAFNALVVEHYENGTFVDVPSVET